MDAIDVFSVMKIVLKNICDEKLSWRMGGSANLLMQGVNIVPSDIDITTDKRSYVIFRKKLEKFFINEGYDEQKKKQYAKYKIKNFELEIAYYNDRPIVMLDKAKIVLWKGIRIPILPLIHAKRFYEIIGKKDKVLLIQKYLK